MSTKQNLCRHAVFSQNCWFVANFVDISLVDDSTSRIILLHVNHHPWPITEWEFIDEGYLQSCN